MYDDIADIYLEIFPINQAFLAFIPEFLGKPGATVLDLGCGPGNYVDTLTRAGFQATGIDNSARMIAEAQTHKQGTFFQLSFTELDRLSGNFDCLYCVGNSLSYLAAKAMPSFLAEVGRLLNPGGNFVIQVVNWDKFRKTGASDFPVHPLSKGRTFHRRYESIDTSQVIFHTEIRKANHVLGSWAAPLFPKYQEAIVADLHRAGLKVNGQFGDYQKSPFNPLASPALILTASKVSAATNFR